MVDVIAWIQLAATVGLLVVTFWYATTTKSMAESAKRSASENALAIAAAERSAEAARDAATVAQSQIRPNFTGRLIGVAPLDAAGEHTASLRVESTGDAVVVQHVRIRRAFRQSSRSESVPTVAISGVSLTPIGLDRRLPWRLHHGEHIVLTHPSIQNDRDDPFTRFLVDVEYTFSESGGAGGTKDLEIDIPPS